MGKARKNVRKDHERFVGEQKVERNVSKNWARDSCWIFCKWENRKLRENCFSLYSVTNVTYPNLNQQHEGGVNEWDIEKKNERTRKGELIWIVSQTVVMVNWNMNQVKWMKSGEKFMTSHVTDELDQVHIKFAQFAINNETVTKLLSIFFCFLFYIATSKNFISSITEEENQHENFANFTFVCAKKMESNQFHVANCVMAYFSFSCISSIELCIGNWKLAQKVNESVSNLPCPISILQTRKSWEKKCYKVLLKIHYRTNVISFRCWRVSKSWNWNLKLAKLISNFNSFFIRLSSRCW